MDRPVTMSVKDFIVRKLSVSLSVPEKVVDGIVTHQFDMASRALDDNNSVEFSGFGKFIFNVKRGRNHLKGLHMLADRYRETMEDETLSPARRKSAEFRLSVLAGDIKFLENKLKDENKRNI